MKEPQSPNEVDLWLANLKGDDKVHVDALLEQLEDFSIALGKEQTRRGSLEEALSNLEESYAIDM